MLTSTSQGRDPNELVEDDSVPSTSGRLHVHPGLCKPTMPFVTSSNHSVKHESCCCNSIQDTSVQVWQEHLLRW